MTPPAISVQVFEPDGWADRIRRYYDEHTSRMTVLPPISAGVTRELEMDIRTNLTRPARQTGGAAPCSAKVLSTG